MSIKNSLYVTARISAGALGVAIIVGSMISYPFLEEHAKLKNGKLPLEVRIVFITKGTVAAIIALIAPSHSSN